MKSQPLLDYLPLDLRRVVENVRAAAARLWERPAYRYAVEHGPAHAARVIALLDGLTEGLMQRREYALAAEEIAILLSAAHLHAIGLQAEQLAPDPAVRWERYPDLGAELIYRALEDPAEAANVGQADVDPGLVEFIAVVVAGHRQTDFAAAEYDDFGMSGVKVRPRLLAALLHLADALDLDYQRVDLEQLKLLAAEPDTALDWWLHHYVSGVLVEDDYVRISYRVPQHAPEYEATLPDLVEHTLRAAFGALRDTFRLYGVKVDIAPPTAVRAMRAVKPMPAEIWAAGERRLADLRGVKPAPVALPELVATVQGLLETMGYTCADACTASAPAPALLCFRCAPQGGLRPPLLVGCQTDGSLTSSDVTVLAQQLAPTEQGYLVAEARVLESARHAAEATGGRVRVFTLSAFYHELLDFRAYAQRLVDDYTGSDLARVYVDLNAVRFTYDARGQAAGEDHFKPLDGYVDVWLKERGGARNHLSLLGEYGAGKTSFCRQYAAEQARRWLADPDRERLPLLITLREYTKTLDVENLITAALVNEYGIQGATFAAFARFNADGKLLLLFDGFDEMAQRTGARTAVDNFWELARVVTPGSKVLLTSRTHYFRTHHEAEALLHGRGGADVDWDELLLPTADGRPPTEDPAVAGRRSAVTPDYIDLHDRPNFEVLHLEPFSDADIQAVLRKRFPDTWEQHWTQIQAIYNLPDLARRPVLLEMIMQTLPELRAGESVNVARLYQVYTAQWLERDVGQGRVLLTPEQRRAFAEALAWELFQRGEPSLHFSQLTGQAAVHFGLADAEQIDHFTADVRTCNFLNRDAAGYYTFAHKSFMEFFVACRLHRLMLQDQATLNGPVKINEEIRLFINGLFALEPKVEPGPPCEPPAGFVWVPPGEFILGGPDGLELQISKLGKGFFIGKSQVTNSQYAYFKGQNGYTRKEFWDLEGWRQREEEVWTKPKMWGQRGSTYPNTPVIGVSHYEAQAYCRWLPEKLGANWLACLPTEIEWEKAARGVDGRLYPWGKWAADHCNVAETGIGKTTPVGNFSPIGDSPYGIQDLAGNVWEWTEGVWGSSQIYRIIRGGAFNGYTYSARSDLRYKEAMAYRSQFVGFRVILILRSNESDDKGESI